ncbi:MAG: 2-isopropylmalate synthase [Chloroflexi bacterium]|nr:2-isopropylmalate synthase [Chloroflexota bacterium]
MSDNKIIIFDTTLRDGEQSPGATLTMKEKLEIAQQLDKLGVDVIEAGFPATSPGDFEAVHLIAEKVRRPIICALAHANPEAVDAAWNAIKGAAHPRLHVFLSSSDIHIAHQLRKDRDEILNLAVAMVARAKGYTEDVEFSPMDTTRSDAAYIYQILKSVIDVGATTVNIADTVGYTTPQEFGELIEGVFKKVPNIGRALVSVHCHNDLGLAVANSLESLRRGVRQVECTINGIGERAGNASLEEIVMALQTRRDFFAFTTNIDTTQIYKTSRLVSRLTGMPVQPNKAIVGANAFRHESGIHQDGVLKERSTYEIMDPRSIGLTGSTLSLGKLSGRHAFRNHLQELGYYLNDEELATAFKAFKELADKKKEVTDRDLEALLGDALRNGIETFHLERVHYSGGHTMPTASVKLVDAQGKTWEDAALGDGPVDAAYQAINRIVGTPNELVEFNINSVTEGKEAVGEAMIRIESEGQVYTGRGADTDIVVASAKAYVNALNRLLGAQKGKGGQSP